MACMNESDVYWHVEPVIEGILDLPYLAERGSVDEEDVDRILAALVERAFEKRPSLRRRFAVEILDELVEGLHERAGDGVDRGVEPAEYSGAAGLVWEVRRDWEAAS